MKSRFSAVSRRIKLDKTNPILAAYPPAKREPLFRNPKSSLTRIHTGTSSARRFGTTWSRGLDFQKSVGNLRRQRSRPGSTWSGPVHRTPTRTARWPLSPASVSIAFPPPETGWTERRAPPTNPVDAEGSCGKLHPNFGAVARIVQSPPSPSGHFITRVQASGLVHDREWKRRKPTSVEACVPHGPWRAPPIPRRCPNHLFEQVPSMMPSRIHHHDVRMNA